MQIGTWKEEADQFAVLGYYHQRSRLLLIPVPPDTPDFHICDFLWPTSLLMLAVQRVIMPFRFVRLRLHSKAVVWVHFPGVERVPDLSSHISASPLPPPINTGATNSY